MAAMGVGKVVSLTLVLADHVTDRGQWHLGPLYMQ